MNYETGSSSPFFRLRRLLFEGSNKLSTASLGRFCCVVDESVKTSCARILLARWVCERDVLVGHVVAVGA